MSEMYRGDIEDCIAEITDEFSRYLAKEIRSVWNEMTREEVSKFAADYEGNLRADTFVRTVMLAILDSQKVHFDSETIHPNISKVKKIAKRK